MNSIKNLVLVYGYARSGKTTLLHRLEQKGYLTLSTSKELDYITVDYYYLPRYFIDILRHKDDRALRDHFYRHNYLFEAIPQIPPDKLTCRDIKIHTAEKYFVPSFGRGELIHRTFFNQYDPQNNGEFIFLETIGGKESDLIKDYWTSHYRGNIIEINLRRDSEQPGVDIRQLAPHGRTFHNNGDSLHLLTDRFISTIQQIQILNAK